VGGITSDILQVREGSFYPGALEKGLCSERALTMALAEMYVQGVSTREVKAITEQLFGTEISYNSMKSAHAIYQEAGVRKVDTPSDFPETLKPIVVFMEMDLEEA
jgi:putative transposase